MSIFITKNLNAVIILSTNNILFFCYGNVPQVTVIAKITPVIRHHSRCTCASVGIASSSFTNSSREYKTLRDLQVFTPVLEFSFLFTRSRCRLYLEPHESNPLSRILFLHDRVHIILTSALRSSKRPFLSRFYT